MYQPRPIDVLAMQKLAPARAAAVTEGGYTLHQAADYPSRMAAITALRDKIRAVITNGRGGLPTEEMEQLPHLEIVCALGAGYEAVDLDLARRRGIAVTNCPGVTAPAVADSAIMLMMATSRSLIPADRAARAGIWQQDWIGNWPTLTGKRIGILGLGNIGGNIAQRAAGGFNMEVGYHNRRVVADVPYRYFDDLAAMAEWTDFLVISAPGGDGTRHLVDARVLAALGPSGYLVNVGRGPIVDNAALIEALRTKSIGGAGLDVVEGEPDHIPRELFAFENLVITPHYAGRAPESVAASGQLMRANLDAHFGGKPLVTPVPEMA